MSPSAPPLIWLRAFESAARLGSFKAAAAELNVSPSTISHQIRDLEAALSVLLFERQQRSNVLTDEGLAFFQPLTEGFALINSANDLLVDSRTDTLTIGAFPFMVSEILTPNLAEIIRVTEKAHIRFRTDTATSSLLRASADERTDVIIRYGRNIETPFRGFKNKKLFRAHLAPIQAAASPQIRSLEELAAQPKIKVNGPFDGWGRWATHFNTPLDDESYAVETDSFHAAVRAVEKGLGVSLGIFPYMNPLLQQGHIRVLDTFSCDTNESAYLVYAPHQKDDPAITNLSHWLVDYFR